MTKSVILYQNDQNASSTKIHSTPLNFRSFLFLHCRPESGAFQLCVSVEIQLITNGTWHRCLGPIRWPLPHYQARPANSGDSGPLRAYLGDAFWSFCVILTLLVVLGPNLVVLRPKRKKVNFATRRRQDPSDYLNIYLFREKKKMFGIFFRRHIYP